MIRRNDFFYLYNDNSKQLLLLHHTTLTEKKKSFSCKKILLRRIPKAKPRRTTVEDVVTRSSAGLIFLPNIPCHSAQMAFFETTVCDAFVAAVENVVKTHTMSGSSRLASEKAKEKTRSKEATNAAAVHHGKQNNDRQRKQILMICKPFLVQRKVINL